MSEDSFPPYVLSPHAALGGYLDIVHSLYMEDRLDVALQAAHDAFKSTGWPAGEWTEFYNTLLCEADARAASNTVRLDSMLAIEVPREAGDAVRDAAGTAALEARARVTELLEVEITHPCLITLLLPEAPLQFISSPYGYAIRKNTLSKICVPWDNAQESKRLLSTLLHEFSHVACTEIAGDDIPSWLNEGLALYVCGAASHQTCAELIRSDRHYLHLLSIDGIENGLNSLELRKDDPSLVGAAYDFAGSLLLWWIEKAGLARVRRSLELIGRGWSPTLAAYAGARVWMWRMVRQWKKRILSMAEG